MIILVNSTRLIVCRLFIFVLVVSYCCHGFQVIQHINRNLQCRATFDITASNNINNIDISIKTSNSIRFNGGGIKFWWQCGVSKFLQEQSELINLKNKTLLGSSAGSLTAALTYLEIDMDKCAEYAINQAYRENLWQKPFGLLGVWGELVREWLNFLIDDDKFNAYKNDDKNRLYIAATPFSLRQTFKNGRKPVYLSSFQTKAELIEACMASIHIPFFMDGKVYSKYQDKRYIDGSFWSFVRKKDLIDDHDIQLPSPIYNIDWRLDKQFEEKFSTNFVDLITPDCLYEMMNCGYNYMKTEYDKEL